jgi:cob(I)alamin adenosyltransferase
MVQLTKIYTRTGDKGKTSLGDGKRVLKSSSRIEAIGTIDEVNALLGVLQAQCQDHISVGDLIRHIQNDLFDMGADLCMPDGESCLRLQEKQVVFLEENLDGYNSNLNPLTSFILPGGHRLAADYHYARTVVRRAERCLTALHESHPINPYIIHYTNRLSDLLFVLARYFNNKGKDDVLWEPAKHQEETKDS